MTVRINIGNSRFWVEESRIRIFGPKNIINLTNPETPGNLPNQDWLGQSKVVIN